MNDQNIERNNTKYEVLKSKGLPPIDLIKILHNNGHLFASPMTSGYDYPAKREDKHYFHSSNLPDITFREASSSESISILQATLNDLDGSFPFRKKFALGRILGTVEGVIANPPKGFPLWRYSKGISKEEEQVIKECISKSRRIKVGKGHIYLGENDFGFAEHESFDRGTQNIDTFVRGGLARILEHTSGDVAENFRKIASLSKKGNIVHVDDGFRLPDNSDINQNRHYLYQMEMASIDSFVNLIRCGAYSKISGGRYTKSEFSKINEEDDPYTKLKEDTLIIDSTNQGESSYFEILDKK
ncbi:MAG: hypothetical protein Q7R87_01660 [Nanoarchaeota archaeon]|nr:hypothetical protein [Nanoarchaeota archaeon]